MPSFERLKRIIVIEGGFDGTAANNRQSGVETNNKNNPHTKPTSLQNGKDIITESQDEKQTKGELLPNYVDDSDDIVDSRRHRLHLNFFAL